jgi:isoquinoline 1-oxidoreductase alpha subunit
MQLNINGKQIEVEITPGMPLLWVLRDTLGMTGTKFGCGMALCGACTVHIDGLPTRACVTPVASLEGRRITTIEGLSVNGDHPVQKAWVAAGVPQCGYCQSGQIMAAAALLKSTPKPDRKQIADAMSGNICRCGTYSQIVSAIETAAGIKRKEASK